MNVTTSQINLVTALRAVEEFAKGDALTTRIASVEHELSHASREEIVARLTSKGFGEQTLLAALAIKAAAGQINVVIHALGILMSLEHVLVPGENVQSLSLGAGNTGRPFDLETDRQIAEFKFIRWRGRDTIRQNSTFVDIFNLCSARTKRRRVLYVLDKAHPLRFLRGRRALASVLSKNAGAARRFSELHGTKYERVGQYYATIEKRIEIVDLRDLVPAFKKVSSDSMDEVSCE